MIDIIVGLFLYYGRVVDQTILTVLNEIGIQQLKPTKQTKERETMLLAYFSTHYNAVSCYYVSYMCLHIIDIDAVYVVAPGAKSRFLSIFT